MLHQPDLLLFDLDGTLSDPIQGIWRSLNYALAHFCYEPLKLAEVARYIGPPLDHIFEEITGTEVEVPALIAKYRERYAASGYAENTLYPDVAGVLSKLAAAQIPIALCTSKRQDFAQQILEMFGLAPYFQFVSGGEIGIPKYRQVEALLLQGQISQSTLMIGDRAVDMIAAHKNGLQAGAVLWGYGSQQELLNENPEYVFTAPGDLLKFDNHS